MDKLKSMWKSKKGFKGSGHVLGSTDTQTPAASSRNKDRQNKSSAGSQRQPVTRQPSAPSPGKRLGSASDNPGRPAQSTSAQRQQEVTHTSSDKAWLPVDGVSSSTQPARSSSPDPANDDVQDAVALLLSDDRPGAPAVSILTRLLRNIVASPSDLKYRRLRLQNPKIKDAVVDATGGIELLQACGFELIFERTEGSEEDEGFAVLPDAADIGQVCAALYLLSPAEPRLAPSRATSDPTCSSAPAEPFSQLGQPPAASSSTSGTQSPTPSAPAAVQPRPRATQVLIPVDSGAEVAEWVFERSPAELKSAVMAARRKREQSEMLMTRAMKEKLALGDRRSSPAWGTVRVRMPEGLLLQGEFAALEPCTAVFVWLTDCLQDPGETYRLVPPRAAALQPSSVTLRDAGLLPSVLLHFQREGRGREQVPALSQDLLAQAK